MGIQGISSGISAYAAVANATQRPDATSAADDTQSATHQDLPAAVPAEAPTRASAADAGETVKLSPEALDQLRQLQARDRQVRQHEQAHLAAAGGLATSGASYTYETGPDGVSYAIGGEVSIDVSPGRTPEETIARARTIEAAALAPADPSGADHAIAAEARQMEQEARTELQLQQIAELQERSKTSLQDNVKQTYGASEHTSAKASRINLYA